MPELTNEQLQRGLQYLRSREERILTDEQIVAQWFSIFHPKDEHESDRKA